MILHGKDIIDAEVGIHYQITSQSAIITTLHQHDFYEIFLVIDGSMDHLINGRAQYLEKNALVFIRPEDEHYYRHIRGRLLNIAFTAEIFGKIDALLQIKDYGDVRLTEHDAERILDGIGEVLAGGMTKEEAALRLKLLLITLFSFFYRTGKHMEYPYWLADLLSSMNTRQNIAEGLQKLYRLSPKTPEHTTRSFRRYLGKTPTEYINDLRLNYSENLLLTTDRSVTDICFETGFRDTSYFYVCFKKKYGCSPTEYRKINKKQLL